jgi:hypothetical protein
MSRGQIKKHEQDWAQAVVEEGPRWINMKPMRSSPPTRLAALLGKAEDRTDLSSVDYKIQSEELSDLTVNVYGNIAVATATNTMKGRIRGRI